MSHRSILSVQLAPGEKNRWQAYCQDRNLTPSAAIRQIVAQLLAKQARPTGPVAQHDEMPDPTRARLELRLSDSELQAVREIARTTGESPNRWVASLVRAYITRKPQLGMHELAVIAESNARLLAMGRNLNQIARALNSGERAIAPDLVPTELTADITAHVGAVSKAIRANLERWSVTWP